MIPLSEKFRARVDSLYKSQQNRAKEKRDKNGRIIRQGYVLPFDRRVFAAWLLEQFHGESGAIQCRYCRRAIDIFNCELDHGIPISRGGSPGLANLSATCAPCNDVKGKMTPEEMEFFLARMVDMGNHFHNGIAVRNITHRLESYSAMKATVNRAHASRAKQQVAAVVEEDF